jgi:protein TonB
MQRATGAAVLFSVVMHACMLIGLTQYSMCPDADLNLDPQDRRLPIKVMLLAESMAAPKTMVNKAAAGSVTPSSVDRPRQPVVSPTVWQTKLPASSREIEAETRSIENSAHGDHIGGSPSDSTTITSKLIAGAVEQSQGDGHATAASTTPVAGQAGPQPIQSARPDFAYNPQPDYPLLLREQGVGGVVWLRVWVDSDGRPVEIKLAKGSGYRLLDDAALRAVKLWRFIPARLGEQRLASWVEFPIRFTLNG